MLRDLFSLFPAYAGVILYAVFEHLYSVPFPRIRGGDPVLLSFCITLHIFSPHTRG